MKKLTQKIYHITNWSAYNRALFNRGNIAIWFDPKTQWYAEPQGKQGRNKTGGVSKSMLALNKSVIKVKESQIKGFKMIFELFRKVATSPKSTPDSMTNSTIVTFNTDGALLHKYVSI